jgi:hypothetical protein
MPPKDPRPRNQETGCASEPLSKQSSEDTLEAELESPRVALTPTALRVLQTLKRVLQNPQTKTFRVDESDIETLRREYGFPESVSVEEILRRLIKLRDRWYRLVRGTLQYEEDTRIMGQMGVNGLKTALETIKSRGGGETIHITPAAHASLFGENKSDATQTEHNQPNVQSVENPVPSDTKDEQTQSGKATGTATYEDHLASLVGHAQEVGRNFDYDIDWYGANTSGIAEIQKKEQNALKASDGGLSKMSAGREKAEEMREVAASGARMMEELLGRMKNSALVDDTREPLFWGPHTPEEIDEAIRRVVEASKSSRPIPPQTPPQTEEDGQIFKAEIPQGNPPERAPSMTRRVIDGIPEVRDRYFGLKGVEIPRPGTRIDAGDGENWVVLSTTDEHIRLVAKDGTKQRDIPLAEFASARRRAEEAEQKMLEETQAALEKMPESERFSLGATLERIRFDTSRGVAESASFILEKVSKIFAGKPTGRFIEALSVAYRNRAEEETKRLEELEKTRKEGTSAGVAYQTLASSGSIAANVLKYGRILADIAGHTAAAPLRWVTLGAVVAKEAAEATKEARFTYDEVKEKTRIQDIDRAHDEAIALTERALKNKGLTLEDLANGKSVSAEELQAAYHEGLPKDILERLRAEPMPGTGRGIVERMYRTYVEWRAKGMQKKIDAIDAGPEDAQVKAAKKRELLLRFGRSKALNDFDRMLSEQGTLDRIAMGADIGSIISKAAIYGTMAQSVYLLFDRIAEAISDSGAEVVPVGPVSDMVDQSSVEEAITSESVVENTPGTESSFIDAKSEWGVIEHGGEAAEHVPLPKYKVELGDSTYKILRQHVPAFRDLGDGQVREYAMTRFLNILNELGPEAIRSAGISSGNTQQIGLNDIIDIEYLDQLARRDIGGEGSVIEQAIKRFGASMPRDIPYTVPENLSIDPPAIREIVEPIEMNEALEQFAREAVREETMFQYIDGLIVNEDFQGNRALWNSFAIQDAHRFFETPQTTTEGVLLQKRLLSLAQIAEVAPSPYENVHDFVDRAFRAFIERSGVEPQREETIGAYLERATDAYIRAHPEIFNSR